MLTALRLERQPSVTGGHYSALSFKWGLLKDTGLNDSGFSAKMWLLGSKGGNKINTKKTTQFKMRDESGLYHLAVKIKCVLNKIIFNW